MISVELVRWTKDPKEAMAIAGSNCYDSIPTERIADHCYSSGHHSVLEFAVFHFKIKGVSRALTHQLVRHRIASYAQRSQRYCSEDGFGYVVPKTIDPDKIYTINVSDISYLSPEDIELGWESCDQVNMSYNDLMAIIEKMYKAMQDDGVPNEDARYVLPNACESVIDVMMDFRTLMNFMNERLCTNAQWEVRELANKMRTEVSKVAPEMVNFLVPKCEKNKPYCFCTESKKRCCGRQPHISETYRRV